MEKHWKKAGIFIGAAGLASLVWLWRMPSEPAVVLENGDIEASQSAHDETNPSDDAGKAVDGLAPGASVSEAPQPATETPTVDPPRAVEKDITPVSTKITSGFKSINRLVSFGFGAADRKPRDIDTVVLHSSYNNQGGDRYSVEKVIGIWKSYEVAPHYLIDRKGNIYQLVDESDIAYHAGVSEMKDGRTNVNTFSIGVEILNAQDDEYTEAEYAAVRNLIAELKKTYPIKYVVGHDDIAPGRKTDPWNFEWKRL